MSQVGDFGEPAVIRDGVLSCRCREEYLHHNSVTVIQRPAEDGPARAISVSKDDEVSVRSATDSEVLGRRDGLLIRFECENCGKRHVLGISQHKGRTYVGCRRPLSASRKHFNPDWLGRHDGGLERLP